MAQVTNIIWAINHFDFDEYIRLTSERQLQQDEINEIARAFNREFFHFTNFVRIYNPRPIDAFNNQLFIYREINRLEGNYSLSSDDTLHDNKHEYYCGSMRQIGGESAISDPASRLEYMLMGHISNDPRLKLFKKVKISVKLYYGYIASFSDYCLIKSMLVNGACHEPGKPLCNFSEISYIIYRRVHYQHARIRRAQIKAELSGI